MNSVLKHWSVTSCVGSQSVPSCHVAPLLGLDYDAWQFQDDEQVNVSCHYAFMSIGADFFPSFPYPFLLPSFLTLSPHPVLSRYPYLPGVPPLKPATESGECCNLPLWVQNSLAAK